MERKKYSRRDILKVSGLATVAVLGRKFISNEHQILNNPYNNAEALSPLVRVGKSKIFEVGEDRVLVSPRKDPLVNALTSIATIESGEKGIHRLGAFLEETPLTVGVNNSKNIEEWGLYTPQLIGGPKITYNYKLIEALYHSHINQDKAAEFVNNQVVWHELYHLWQNVEIPFSTILSTEKKAWGVVEEMMWISLDNYLKNGDTESHQYFTFS